jgi:tRNA (guanine26-N2/guanine27-N2)-dimethyltransferase
VGLFLPEGYESSLIYPIFYIYPSIKDARTGSTVLEYMYKQVTEGLAAIQVPEIVDSIGLNDEQARSRAPVFYNPVMKMNRDSTVLVLRAFTVQTGRNITVCEPMCGTGIRGIRIVKEVPGVEQMLLGDLNPSAIRLADRNIVANNAQDVCKTRLMEANLLLSLHARPLFRFDYIDIDPYGSPVQYLDSAIRACRKKGIIALTATDMAPLCGVNVKTCIRKYGGRPQRTPYCHEQALRLIVSSLAKVASRHETAIWPIFSYASDHYARIYVRTERGAKVTNRCLSNIGYIHHCHSCQYHVSSRHESRRICPECRTEMTTAGPLWIGDLAETDFTNLMLKQSADTQVEYQLLGLIEKVTEEILFSPGFYDLDQFCSKMGIVSQSLDKTLAALREMGYMACRVHSSSRGFKTDAFPSEIEDTIRRL